MILGKGEPLGEQRYNHTEIAWHKKISSLILGAVIKQLTSRERPEHCDNVRRKEIEMVEARGLAEQNNRGRLRDRGERREQEGDE